MIKYRVGDIVQVLDSPRMRRWRHGSEVIGMKFEITEYDMSTFMDMGIFMFLDNKYLIDFHPGDLMIIKREVKEYNIVKFCREHYNKKEAVR